MARTEYREAEVGMRDAVTDEPGVLVWRTAAAPRRAEGERSALPIRLVSRYRYQIYPVLAILVFIAAWEGAVRAFDIQPIYLPPPSGIAVTFWELVGDPGFYGHLSATLQRIFIGFALGATIGLVFGLVMGRWPVARAIGDTFISMFYPLPKIALIPLLIVWFGLGDTYKVAISAFSTFFPVVISTYVGIQQVDPKLKKAAKDLGCMGRRLYQRVIIPAALPSIMGGVRLGLGVSIILVIGAEMVGSNDGIGYLLIFAGQVLQTQRVFAILVVLTIIGYVLLKAELLVEKWAMPWSHSGRGNVTV